MPETQPRNHEAAIIASPASRSTSYGAEGWPSALHASLSGSIDPAEGESENESNAGRIDGGTRASACGEANTV